MALPGTDPESCITEYTLEYEEYEQPIKSCQKISSYLVV